MSFFGSEAKFEELSDSAHASAQKYCLKIPGVIGGEHGGDNLGRISLDELIRASGHIA